MSGEEKKLPVEAAGEERPEDYRVLVRELVQGRDFDPVRIATRSVQADAWGWVGGALGVVVASYGVAALLPGAWSAAVIGAVLWVGLAPALGAVSAKAYLEGRRPGPARLLRESQLPAAWMAAAAGAGMALVGLLEGSVSLAGWLLALPALSLLVGLYLYEVSFRGRSGAGAGVQALARLGWSLSHPARALWYLGGPLVRAYVGAILAFAALRVGSYLVLFPFMAAFGGDAMWLGVLQVFLTATPLVLLVQWGAAVMTLACARLDARDELRRLGGAASAPEGEGAEE